MILWMDGAHDPSENMRRDSMLLHAAARQGPLTEAVLRVFNFAPHGITLGHAQRPEHVLDLDRCRAAGVPWAVRPTGGRAIFHAEEWTYSLVAANADREWGGTLTQTYERASEVILAALRRLHVPADLARRRGSPAGNDTPVPATPRVERLAREVAVERTSSPACFATAARHEILLDGKKLVGSAQRRVAGALLQQGSVLIGPGHLRLVDYLAVPEPRREGLRIALGAGATDASRYLGADLRLERWAQSLMLELPRGTRRLDGESGLDLLTLSETAPYTRPAVATGRTSPGG
jgi:lipoate-protein ligase A